MKKKILTEDYILLRLNADAKPKLIQIPNGREAQVFDNQKFENYTVIQVNNDRPEGSSIDIGDNVLIGVDMKNIFLPLPVEIEGERLYLTREANVALILREA
jgi:hypothetical protein